MIWHIFFQDVMPMWIILLGFLTDSISNNRGRKLYSHKKAKSQGLLQQLLCLHNPLLFAKQVKIPFAQNRGQ